MRRIAIAAASLLAPSAAWAAEGMPQLNFANPLTLSQVVWGGIIFAALYVIFARWGLPQVGAVLAERDARINGDLDAAREAKARADAAVTELTDATHKARGEAQAAVNAAVERSRKEAAERSAHLNAKLDEQLAAAEQRIAAARNTAMGALRQVATETATVVVSRLTGHTPAQGAIENAVGSALAARGQG